MRTKLLISSVGLVYALCMTHKDHARQSLSTRRPWRYRSATPFVVAYCRRPYCVMAVDAVEVLRKKGFKAHRMEQGVVDWRARGWRVDSEAAR